MALLTVEHLITHFERTKEGAKIISQITQSAIDERQPKLSEIAEIRADSAKRRPQFQAALDDALAREKQAQAALEQAQHARMQAAAELMSLSNRISNRIDALHRKLRDGMPKESRELLYQLDTEMNELWNKTRNSVETDERSTGRHAASRVGVHVPIRNLYSNRDAINERLAAIQKVRRIAREELPLAADVSQAAIAARLEELRKSIPTDLPLRHIATVAGASPIGNLVLPDAVTA